MQSLKTFLICVDFLMKVFWRITLVFRELLENFMKYILVVFGVRSFSFDEEIVVLFFSFRLYAGPEVDVWSCGILLYALLCGCVSGGQVSRHQLGSFGSRIHFRGKP